MPLPSDDYSAEQAVLLGDGRVLAVRGNRTAFTWNPSSGAWKATQGLNKDRSEFAAVALHDGRVLVTAGVNTTGRGSCGNQSYSSSYIFDPADERWSSVGLLGAARTAPAAAVLHDGRVLVAGGYFFANDPGYCSTSEADLTAYRGSSAPVDHGRLNDVDPGVWGSAMATAELFDPATGTWSSTGHLVYARMGAASVTLADGRVLVVGAGGQPVHAPQGAFETAEIYDPATGRFSLTGSLPPLDRPALAKLGLDIPDDSGREFGGPGTLVALPDGGAVLVGFTTWWKHAAQITRTFRYDARSGAWTELGMPYVWLNDFQADTIHETASPNRYGSFVAGLLDGRVLVAGETHGLNAPQTASELFDPATNAWSKLPPMLDSRSDGTAVTLADGSVLLVGGGEIPGSAIRFIPGP